jgi:hypothetical protein
MNTDIEKIKKNIIEQAKYYLVKVGGFHPFGAAVNPDGTVSPLTAYVDSDTPDPLDVIKILEDGIIWKLKTKNALAAGIGVDVLHKPEGESQKRDAIQIKILTIDLESVDYFLYYRLADGKYIYEEIIIEEGTLVFK